MRHLRMRLLWSSLLLLAANAALTAVAMLAANDDALAARLEQFRLDQTAAARAMILPV